MLPMTPLLHFPKRESSRGKSHSDVGELVRFLDTLGIEVVAVDVKVGAICTTFYVQPINGTRYAAITSAENDIALYLGSPTIRIFRAGTSVAIEAIRSSREQIWLREVFETPEYATAIFPGRDLSNYGLNLALGVKSDGAPMILDLVDAPHLLIGGSTGGGKSVSLHAMIISLLYRYLPCQLQLGMVDFKRLELGLYENLPHVEDYGVAYTPQEGKALLEKALLNTRYRYEILKSARMLDHESYIRSYRVLPKEFPAIPYLVLVVDEFAELILNDKSIRDVVVELSQLGRAAGVHLILATQRPEVRAVAGLIKANMGARIAFKTTSAIDSRIILDRSGAEDLIGKGDGLILSDGELTRFQGAYISKEEISRVVEFIAAQ